MLGAGSQVLSLLCCLSLSLCMATLQGAWQPMRQLACRMQLSEQQIFHKVERSTVQQAASLITAHMSPLRAATTVRNA
jgi:hypothetical protein